MTICLKGGNKKQKRCTCKSSWAPRSYKHALSSSPSFFWSRLITEYKAHLTGGLQYQRYDYTVFSLKTKSSPFVPSIRATEARLQSINVHKAVTSWLRPMTCQALCILHTFSRVTLMATLSNGYHCSQLQMRKLSVTCSRASRCRERGWDSNPGTRSQRPQLLSITQCPEVKQFYQRN